MESPLTNGIITNFEIAEIIIKHAIEDQLHLIPSNHPIVMSEAPFNTMESREKLVSMLFEIFEVPAVYLAKDPVLTSFAHGKQTALVLDSGAGVTSVSPVFEGYTLNQGVVYNNYAGNYVSDNLLKYIRNRNSIVRTPYSYKKKKIAEGEFKYEYLNFPNTHETYETWCLRNLLEDVKISLFRIHEEPWRPSGHIPIVEYELPDETKLSVGVERFSVPEEFFSPSARLQNELHQLNQMVDTHSHDHFIEVKAYQLLAYSSIMRSPVDVRKELFGTSILTGGNSLLHGFAKRFENELTSLAPHNIRVKAPISSSNLSQEKKCTSWVGGSILGSVGGFQQMWITKDQFEEHSASIVHRKFI